MKKILIYDCAAESGGALSILNMFYNRYSKTNEGIIFFVTGIIDIQQNDHIHNIKIPWAKKSIFHRVFCDFIYMPYLINNLHPNEVISLQNVKIPFCKIFQTVYVHNIIPFSNIKFDFFTDTYLWFYKNIVGKLIICSIKNADQIIVQGDWIKNIIVNTLNIDTNKILVDEVVLSGHIEQRRISEKTATFFYPAAAHSYKNHLLICKACMHLKQINVTNYKVLFTISKDDNKLSKKIFSYIQDNKIPIELIGNISKQEMALNYSRSILLFPSYLETVGLPLIETQNYCSPIFVADCDYAHYVLKNYKKCWYFKDNDFIKLSNLMKMGIENWREINFKNY